ncbi:MAG: superinfection immunity protein [Acidithiobacillus ferriphilus]
MMHWLMGTRQGAVFVMFFGVLVLLVLYLAPSLLAWTQGAIHLRGIVLCNLLLGWTVLGWVAALVWALMDQSRDADRDTWPEVNNVIEGEHQE